MVAGGAFEWHLLRNCRRNYAGYLFVHLLDTDAVSASFAGAGNDQSEVPTEGTLILYPWNKRSKGNTPIVNK